MVFGFAAAFLVVERVRGEASAPPPEAMTAEAATSQVVDAAAQTVHSARLTDTAGATSLQSCQNLRDAPYRAAVNLTFILPQGNSVGYLNDVAAAMAGVGWAESASTGEHFGHVLTRGVLVATFHRNTEQLDVATMELSGPCAVVGDHRNDASVWTDVTERIRPGG